MLEIFYGLAEIEYFFDVLLENEYTDYDVLSLSRITEGTASSAVSRHAACQLGLHVYIYRIPR